LLAEGFTRSEARIISDEYVLAELKGIRSHGIFAFLRGGYWTSKRKPIGAGRARRFQVIRNHPGYAYIDGRGDAGQLAAHSAIRNAVQKAKKAGVAMVGGGNIQGFLRPGTWAEWAAEQGMISICLIYGGGPLLAPTGSREPILSTNPIGIGIPYTPYPIVIDMATSERAYNYVKLATTLGIKVDSTWGIDKQGKSTTDPKKLIAVLPFGGYKGYALSLAFEILTGPLVRTPIGKKTTLKRGFLFLVINPLAFTSKKAFQTETHELIHSIKAAKRLPGVREIHIPGEKSSKLEALQRKRGWFDIDEKIIKDIKAL
jgi:LDH2 family malate/lactate/ureidoglycolate dehydrogenase